MSDDSKTLFPAIEVTAGGETISISPFFFGQLPKAVKLLRPLVDALGSANVLTFDGAGATLAADWPARLPQIIDEGGEALISLLAFAINKPRAWFDTLGADDGIALTRAVFEANGSFFAERIAPMLSVAVQPAQDGAASSQP